MQLTLKYKLLLARFGVKLERLTEAILTLGEIVGYLVTLPLWGPLWLLNRVLNLVVGTTKDLTDGEWNYLKERLNARRARTRA